MTIKYAMFNKELYYDESADTMIEMSTIVPAEDIVDLVDLSEQRVVLLPGLSQEAAEKLMAELRKDYDLLTCETYEAVAVIDVNCPDAKAVEAGPTETRRDVTCYHLDEEIIYNLLDCEGSSCYEYWDGSNWRKVWIEQGDITEVEVEDTPDDLDSYHDGNHYYKRSFRHGRIYRVLAVDGEKPAESTWLLREYTDYQDSIPGGRLIDASERCRILVEAGVDGYFSTSEAAEVLGISERRVRALCAAGRMGRQVGTTWVITPEEIEANKVRKPGRPAKSE